MAFPRLRVLLLSAALAGAQAQGATAPGPRYELRLDERSALQVQMALVLPDDREERIGVDPATAISLASGPRCPAGTLERLAAGSWLKPRGCSRVSWSAHLADLDASGTDASRPAAGWSARHRLWLLGATLPWLRATASGSAPVVAAARFAGGKRIARSFTKSPNGAPLAVVVAQRPAQRFRAGGMTMRVHGDAPGAAYADLQRSVAVTWAQWRRDILPKGSRSPRALDVLWLRPASGAEPGFFASSGSDAILMQHVPAPADPDDAVKLRAGIMLIGAHEGFHALTDSLPGARPAWVGESWASHFAWRAARRHLSGPGLAHAEALVQTRVPLSILEAQRRWDSGNQGQALVFYSKGARFWAAIEAVLEGPANGSGRLAELIRSSETMRRLDWKDADAVAAFFDAHSGGRAGPIVRCYLAGTGCP